MNTLKVKPTESGFVMTHVLRSCRRKLFKKGSFANDKLTSEEQEQFTNCMSKYLDTSYYSNEGLRAGLIDTL